VSFFLRGFEENANLPSYLTKAQFETDPRRIGAYPVSTERSGAATGLKYERALGNDDFVSVDTFHQEMKDKTYDTIRNSRTSISPEYKTTWRGNQLIFGGEFADAKANTDTKKQVGQQTQSVFVQAFHPLTKKTTVDVGLRTQPNNKWSINDLCNGSQNWRLSWCLDSIDRHVFVACRCFDGFSFSECG
jgi:hypothetical protein